MHMEPEVIYLFHADVGYVPKKSNERGTQSESDEVCLQARQEAVRYDHGGKERRV